jgi:hypothetical protein
MLHDLLHAIIDKLPVHEGEKAELHAQVDAQTAVAPETEENPNGND